MSADKLMSVDMLMSMGTSMSADKLVSADMLMSMGALMSRQVDVCRQVAGVHVYGRFDVYRQVDVCRQVAGVQSPSCGEAFALRWGTDGKLGWAALSAF